jgi:UDP-N-acetylglucosamine transferase subunit ALG13
METPFKILQECHLWRSDILIFVTVGTHERGFERLIKAVDDLVGSEKIKEKVIIQTGYTEYIPKNCDSFKFTDYDNIVELCRKASIVISHGGVGSIITPLELEKPVIVVPRLKKFNEHTNDHQLQIVKELDRQKKIIPVFDINDLENALEEAKKIENKKYNKQRSKILDIVSNYLSKMEK